MVLGGVFAIFAETCEKEMLIAKFKRGLSARRLVMAALALIVFGSSVCMADHPFRRHRFDVMRSLPVDSTDIVFFGNSITNMHEWWEAFGGDTRILNRGASGASSRELVKNLGSIIDGKPAKIFLMIGTNDISGGKTPVDTVVGNIRRMAERIRRESPRTELYIQSILPRHEQWKNDSNRLANERIERMCGEVGARYVDLWEPLLGVRDKGEWSLDGLHLLAQGYREWCRKIAPLVGRESVYTDSMVNLTSGLPGSLGMRSSYFGMLPLRSTDAIIVGDEMVHGGEWHELLGTPRVKNRGTGWGYGGLTFDQHKAQLKTILTGNGNKQLPSKIFLYCGTKDKDLAAYGSLMEYARSLAPGVPLYVMSQIPVNDPLANAEVAAWNYELKQLCEKKGVTFIDIFHPLLDYDGHTDPDCVKENYLYGKGYVKVASRLAPYLQEEGARPLTEEEYQRVVARRAAPRK